MTDRVLDEAAAESVVAMIECEAEGLIETQAEGDGTGYRITAAGAERARGIVRGLGVEDEEEVEVLVWHGGPGLLGADRYYSREELMRWVESGGLDRIREKALGGPPP